MEDDDEVIIEGSPLHDYVNCFLSEEVETVVNPDTIKVERTFSRTSQSFVKVPKQYLESVQIILKASLLLDYDADLLYQDQAVLAERCEAFSLRHLLGIACFLSVIIYLLTSLFLPMLFLPLLTYGLLYYTTRHKEQYLTEIKELIKSLKHVFTLSRKLMNILKEEEKEAFSRDVMKKLKRGCKINVADKINASEETTKAMRVIVQSLCNLSLSAKKVTNHILNSSHDCQFFRSYTCLSEEADEVLKELTQTSTFKDITLSLNTLRDVYWGMQSECLCVLGQAICSSASTQRPLPPISLIKDYRTTASSEAERLQLWHDQIFVEEVDKTERVINSPKLVNSPKLIDGYRHLQSVSSKLRSLWRDLVFLEDEVENTTDEVSIEMLNSTVEKLDETERELMTIVHRVRMCRTVFLKVLTLSVPYKEDAPVVDHQSLSENQDDEVSKLSLLDIGNGYSVNKDGKDEVFFAVSENYYPEGTACDDAMPSEPDTYVPPALIRELKCILSSRRKEFQERELSSFASESEKVNYLDFIGDPSELANEQREETFALNKKADSTPPLLLPSDTSFEEEKTEECFPVEVETTEQADEEVESVLRRRLVTSFMPLHKCLALEASSSRRFVMSEDNYECVEESEDD